jgi:hypothetical protein
VTLIYVEILPSQMLFAASGEHSNIEAAHRSKYEKKENRGSYKEELNTDRMIRAVSQSLWSHKGREECFLGRKPRKAMWLPRIPCARH